MLLTEGEMVHFRSHLAKIVDVQAHSEDGYVWRSVLLRLETGREIRVDETDIDEALASRVFE